MIKHAEPKVISVQDVVLSNSPQQQLLAPVITKSTAGAENISIGSVLMPPDNTSKVHVHRRHEVIVVLLEGHCATLVGEDLEPMMHKPGDFVYIPPGIVHAAVNISRGFRAIAVEARTDPQFNEDVELMPELDGIAHEIAEGLRNKYSDSHPSYKFNDLL